MATLQTFRATALVAACAFFLQAAAPEGWFLAGSKPGEYQTDIDSTAIYNGRPSAFLKATKPVNGFGTLMQQFVATDFAGKRVRLSAFVKSDKVQDWAGLWMRIDKGKDMLNFDNMQDRPIKGSLGWQRYEVVLDVPEDATGIAFGILLSNSGTVWINSAQFEPVDNTVRVTGSGAVGGKSSGPANLGFEK